MKTYACTLAAILAGLAPLSAQDEPAQNRHANSEPQFVSIFARGEGEIGADSAIVSLNHTAEASQLSEAINLSLKAKENILKKLTAAGIKKSDILFQNFSSSSERGKLLGKVKRHTVSSPIQVTVKTESQFAQIAVLVDSDEKLDYLGRKAHISDPASLQVKAAEDAVKNLKRKIALYESSLGVKLKLVSFGEVSQKQVEEGTLVLDDYSPRARKSTYSAAARQPVAYGGAITQSFGEQKAAVHVQGIYRIVSD